MTILDDIFASMGKDTHPVMHYTAGAYIPRGKAFFIKSDGFYPDVWHFNAEDFEENKAELAQYCTLVDLRTWKPTDVQVEQAFLEILRSLQP